jgi:hypothetical protein
MSWFDDLLGKSVTQKAINFGTNTGINALTEYFGFNEPKVPLVGYQGSIPEYDMLRERVPDTYDPNRRPGSSGQRYFTTPRFVPRGTLPEPMSAEGLAALNLNNPARQTRPVGTGMAAGGIAQLKEATYLDGASDGMADEIPATVEGEQEAMLSDGEFVVPADVVSHLGNGNSDAGAKELYDMMDRIREARTGTKKQGKEIDPDKFLPA